MKQLILLVLAIALYGSGSAYAQENLTKLKSPASPASIVLGLEPGVVFAPKSYRSLETALYSGFLNGGGGATLPSDFALELTPYWMRDHSLSLEEYLFPERVTDQLVRNSSVSIASTQNFTLGDGTASGAIALGYRSTLHFPSEKYRGATLDSLREIKERRQSFARIGSEAQMLFLDPNVTIANLNDFIAEITSVVLEQVQQALPGATNRERSRMIADILQETRQLSDFDLATEEGKDNFLDAFNSMLSSVIGIDRMYESFKSYIEDKRGLYVDLAYAMFLSFPEGDFGGADLPRQSFWITPTYEFGAGLEFLKVLGVFRYEWYGTGYYREFFPQSQIYEDNIDYGISIAAEFEDFSLKYEAVGRSSSTEIPAGTDPQGNTLYRKDEDTDFQHMGSFSYRLNDRINLSYTLGKRFEPILNPNNTLVSLLSLSFGFGTPTTDDLTLD